jgi:putative DNA primase/helicase
VKRPNADAERITEEARRLNGHGPAASVADVFAEAKRPTLAPGESYALTDLGNADRFVDRHEGRVLWSEHMRSYLVWDSRRWAKDEGGGTVARLAQGVARGIHREAAEEADTDAQRRVSRWAVASQSAGRIKAMLELARPHLAVSMDRLDADPWLLNCQNGTLDLKTGELRPHDPLDYVTKIVPVEYDPDAEAPRFSAFLEEVLVDDGVIRFVQRFAGYSLTGDTRERAMAILWGGGKNGKSTLVELLLTMLGDYAPARLVLGSRKGAAAGRI